MLSDLSYQPGRACCVCQAHSHTPAGQCQEEPCDVRCTAQIGYSWDSLGMNGRVQSFVMERKKMQRIDGLRRRAWFLQRVEAKRGERAIGRMGESMKEQEIAHSPWARITDRVTERRHVRADSVLIYTHALIRKFEFTLSRLCR